MSRLTDRLRPPAPTEPAGAAGAAVDPARFGLEQLVEQMSYLGNTYPLGMLRQTMTPDGLEPPDSSFEAAASLQRRVGPIFACILQRGMLFSEARFLWQRMSNGVPGALFGNRSLSLLERPWTNATTAEMLWRAELDVSLAGNFFLWQSGGMLHRLRPDYMSIMIGSDLRVESLEDAPDARVIGYIYGRPGSSAEPRVFLPEEIAHWSPIPDPTFHFRGQPWVHVITTNATSHQKGTAHKSQFFDNAATPNLVVLPDKTVSFDEMKQFADLFRDEHEGLVNAYRTLFLGGGSSVQQIGLSMKDMEYNAIQGSDETMIAAAANVPPIIAGFSEGLQSATYSNYGQARRKFADLFARPQWRSFAAAVEHLLPPPRGGAARLWYYDRDIPALREDSGDEAEIKAKDASTLQMVFNTGFEPDAAVDFVLTGDPGVLRGRHTGKSSVQLQDVDEDPNSSDDNESGETTGENTTPPAADDQDGQNSSDDEADD